MEMQVYDVLTKRVLVTGGSGFLGSHLCGRQEESITVYGDGSQTRWACYVDDIVDGLNRLMKSPDEVTGPMKAGSP